LRHSVGIGEVAAESDLSSYQTKEVRGDYRGANLLRRSVFLEKDVAEGEDAGQVLERVFGAVAHVDEVLVGEGEIADVTIAHVAGGDDQTVGAL